MKRNDLCHLHECLVTELRLRKKKCFSTCLCRSLSQKSDEFEGFCTDLNLFLSSINDLNPAYPVVTGDSNNKSPQWWALDKEIKNDVKLASFLSWFISASGVELSLYEKCHHNFILWKRNFNVSLPPPYIREVWNYEKAKIENIQLAVSGINWDFHFQEESY